MSDRLALVVAVCWMVVIGAAAYGLHTTRSALDQCRAELGRKWEESYKLEERDCSADGACKYTVLVPMD